MAKVSDIKQPDRSRSSPEPDGKAAHEPAAASVQGGTQIDLPFLTVTVPARVALIERWLMLTNQTLPRMAEHQRWPVSQNHCFMRICLDTSLGAPWHSVVKRPALRHISDSQLRDAVAVAERIVETPSLLFELNAQSIEWRK